MEFQRDVYIELHREGKLDEMAGVTEGDYERPFGSYLDYLEQLEWSDDD